jgi:hypothetical protein
MQHEPKNERSRSISETASKQNARSVLLTGKKVNDLQNERKIQLKTVEDIVEKNRYKSHDGVTAMAFKVVEALRKVALGESEALMETLYQMAPAEIAAKIRSPPQMTTELQLAVLNVIGLTPVDKNA